MSEMLKEEIGYVIFTYPTTKFYIKTSFNPNLCKVKPGLFYDIDTGRFVPKYLVQGINMEVRREEPTHLKSQSDFWKSILLEASYANT